MQSLIAQLQFGSDLTAEQIEMAVAALVGPDVNDATKADFLRALGKKGETAREMAAFVRSMLARAIDPGIDPANVPGPMIDVCGTGGDKLHLFNVSTAVMFVLAAGGACVVKHGNRAITSQCGGADVLEELGVRIDLPAAELKRCVERHGLGFLFAPAFHPAFKAIVPVRKALAAEGTPTIFNLLGPLLNPARPAYQLTGIFSPVLLPKYAETFAALGRSHAWVVHGSGMDELSLAGPTAVQEVIDGNVREFIVDAADLGFARCTIDELRGAGRVENARILTSILDGTETGPKRDLVILNAAAGLVITRLAQNLADAVTLAREQISSGRALAKLHALQNFA